MDNHPRRVAFCPLLFAENGGEFTENNKPIFKMDARTYVRGKCDEAYDCGECNILIRWCEKRAAEGYHIGWECVHCLKETKAVLRWLPGFYESSRYRGLPEDWVLVEPERRLDGCTRCGFGTPLLQLVLRR